MLNSYKMNKTKIFDLFRRKKKNHYVRTDCKGCRNLEMWSIAKRIIYIHSPYHFDDILWRERLLKKEMVKELAHNLYEKGAIKFDRQIKDNGDIAITAHLIIKK